MVIYGNMKRLSEKAVFFMCKLYYFCIILLQISRNYIASNTIISNLQIQLELNLQREGHFQPLYEVFCFLMIVSLSYIIKTPQIEKILTYLKKCLSQWYLLSIKLKSISSPCNANLTASMCGITHLRKLSSYRIYLSLQTFRYVIASSKTTS